MKKGFVLILLLVFGAIFACKRIKSIENTFYYSTNNKLTYYQEGFSNFHVYYKSDKIKFENKLYYKLIIERTFPHIIEEKFIRIHRDTIYYYDKKKMIEYPYLPLKPKPNTTFHSVDHNMVKILSVTDSVTIMGVVYKDLLSMMEISCDENGNAIDTVKLYLKKGIGYFAYEKKGKVVGYVKKIETVEKGKQIPCNSGGAE